MAVARHLLLRRKGGAGGTPPATVPEGVIAMWSGLLANIPPGWNLCDGTGVTPNLVARFIKGSSAGVDPGAVGGSDTHTHANMTAAGGHSHTLGALTHNHTVSSAGGHNHNGSLLNRLGGSVIMKGSDSTGAHQHTTNTASHNHTTDATVDHVHLLSTDDGRPPFYEVAYIQAGAGGAAMGIGIIIIWTGTIAAIPAGWSLCDGGGGRPDLRSNFIRGINTAITNPGTTGGAATHLHTETALAAHSHTCNNATAHKHTFNLYTWTHNHNGVSATNGGPDLRQADTGSGNHTHADSNTIDTHNHNPLGNDGGHAHGVNAASSLPAYYDVAFIICTVANIPTSGIFVWTGLLLNIPATYSLCDGGGGRPDLRGQYVRGSDAGADPGGTGGSNTHTHTDQNAGAHNSHSQTAAGNHQHAATDTIGAHTHSIQFRGDPASSSQPALTSQASAGNHSHTYNSEGSHSNHVLTDPGNHNHNPWSNDNGEPAYYEVAFISKN